MNKESEIPAIHIENFKKAVDSFQNINIQILSSDFKFEHTFEKQDPIWKEFTHLPAFINDPDKPTFFVFVNSNRMPHLIYNDKNHLIHINSNGGFIMFNDIKIINKTEEKSRYIKFLMHNNNVSIESVSSENYQLSAQFDKLIADKNIEYHSNFHLGHSQNTYEHFKKTGNNFVFQTLKELSATYDISFKKDKYIVKPRYTNTQFGLFSSFIFDKNIDLTSIEFKNAISKKLQINKHFSESQQYEDIIDYIDKNMEMYKLIHDNAFSIQYNKAIFELEKNKITHVLENFSQINHVIDNISSYQEKLLTTKEQHNFAFIKPLCLDDNDVIYTPEMSHFINNIPPNTNLEGLYTYFTKFIKMLSVMNKNKTDFSNSDIINLDPSLSQQIDDLKNVYEKESELNTINSSTKKIKI